uniref:Iron-sulfur cluster-binding protein n=1 Tax=Aureimonas frigidaquae TaxID=424757 RepID=A0A0P0Z097_9HYPH|nr:iron-sulfur cluster-binding protein [Aureimonas frigidaquae]
MGVAPAAGRDASGARLEQFVNEGLHGTMDWMADTLERRRTVGALWHEARSVIVLGMNYGPAHDPLADLQRRDRGVISVYAQNRDYHDVIKGRLKELAAKLLARARQVLPGEEHGVKVFVDTAPLMEKPLGEAAGLGWQGKHTNLVSREFGSWLFLGSILTTLDLSPDAPGRDLCGSCTACQDICPTKAFPAPYRLDARRCISYLTIETRRPIPRALRAAMGNRIYGCDDCLAVCPWNKFAQAAREARLIGRPELRAPALRDLMALDDAGFRDGFAGSPVKRIGRDKFVSNCLIAAGNAADPSLLPDVEARLDDAAPIVRAMAVWAYGRLAPDRAAARSRQALADEPDAGVRAEWLAVGGTDAA